MNKTAKASSHLKTEVESKELTIKIAALMQTMEG